MKKFIVILLTLAMVLSLAACGSKEAAAPAAEKPAEPAPAATEAPAPADGSFTVTDMAGREVTFEKPVEKAVALTASDCEIIFALGAEEAANVIRRYGADKYTSFDPKGLDNFIKLCHDFGIKIIPYFSSCFFDERDPDFTEKFSPRYKHNLDCSFFRYRMCDPDSAEWDEFSARKMDMFLNDYEFDGIFNDIGYYVDHSTVKNAFIDYDPIFEDQLSRIYSRVKEFGGIIDWPYEVEK